MSQPSQNISSAQRLDMILSRIARTSRGKSLIDWMQRENITPAFIDDAPFIASYQPKEENNESSSPLLLLNAKIDDQALFVFTIDQLRRAWQDKYARSHAPNPNPISFMLTLRFEEADARSFTAAMVMDYTLATKDFSALHFLSQHEGYKPAFQSASMLSARYGEDFHILRRAAFDSFFWEYKEAQTAPVNQDGLTTLEAAEKQYVEGYTKSLTEHFSEVAQLCVEKHFEKTRANPKDKSPLILDFTMDRYDTISVQDYTRYGVDGFDPKAPNYITQVGGPHDVTSDFYLKPTEPALTLLKDYMNRNKNPLQHVNFLGEPKRTKIGAPKP